MKFKAKLFKLGNSKAIYIPKKVYTKLENGAEYEWEVYTNGGKEEEVASKVYTKPKGGKLKFNMKTGVEEWI